MLSELAGLCIVIPNGSLEGREVANRVSSDKDVVETIYGKHSIYEVVKSTSLLSSPKYHIYKNGKHHRGAFSSISAAVQAAEKDG